jgi:hypothetical protein
VDDGLTRLAVDEVVKVVVSTDELVAVLETITVDVVTVARIVAVTVNVVGVRLLSVAVPEAELVDADTLVLMLVAVSEDVEVVVAN